ncbi:MAG: hypothetical protein GC192_22865 [Bacteroidetes bacterium]|nr:hypothetical protein [Bacteroidota bacterium]
MTLKTFLTINAAMFVPFGLGMLSVPLLLFPVLDVHLDGDGLLMAKTVGSMLLSFGVMCFLSRREPLGSAGMKAVLFGNFLFHAFDCLLTGKGAYTGDMNNMGYIFSTMHLLFALGFMYFLIDSKK